MGDGHAVKQRRLLEQETKTDPLPRQLPLAQLGQVPAVEMDRAAGGVQQPNDRLQQNGLAAAALADHGQRLARRDREVDVAEHLLPAEIDPHPLQLN